MKVIGFINQKGGVAKTSSANALAHGLANRGHKVLLVDFDPQGNLTVSCGVDVENDKRVKYQVYEWLQKGKMLKDCLVNINDNLDLVPGGMRLGNAQFELISKPARELQLKKLLTKVPDDYDFVIFDCTPSLDVLTMNVMVAADELIIPFKPEFFSLEGIQTLLYTIKSFKEDFNPELKVLGFLTTMYRKIANSSNEVIDIVAEIAKENKTKVYSSVIPYSVYVADAPSHGKSIFEYQPKSKSAKAYSNFVEEFLEDQKKGKGKK